MNERAEENGTPATVEELDEQLSGRIATNIMQVIGSVLRDRTHTDYPVIWREQRIAVQSLIKNHFAGFWKDARDATTELSTLRAENGRLRERCEAAEKLVRRFYDYHTSSWSTEFARASCMIMLLEDVETWLPDSKNKGGE